MYIRVYVINLSPPSQVNPERVGFYRVGYSSDLFSNLTPALSSHTLSACDRLGLQNDAFAMVSVFTSHVNVSFLTYSAQCLLLSHAKQRSMSLLFSAGACWGGQHGGRAGSVLLLLLRDQLHCLGEPRESCVAV